MANAPHLPELGLVPTTERFRERLVCLERRQIGMDFQHHFLAPPPHRKAQNYGNSAINLCDSYESMITAL